MLEFVPGPGGPLTNLAYPIFHGADLFLDHTPGFALQLFAFLNQTIKELAGVLFRFGVGAKPSQPDLPGGILDLARQLRIIFRIFVVVLRHAYLMGVGH